MPSTSPSTLSALPGAMLGASLWGCFGVDARMCSWCGKRDDGVGERSDDSWNDPQFASIAWTAGTTTERVCPCCPLDPTSSGRAVEVAELVDIATRPAQLDLFAVAA